MAQGSKSASSCRKVEWRLARVEKEQVGDSGVDERSVLSPAIGSLIVQRRPLPLSRGVPPQHSTRDVQQHIDNIYVCVVTSVRCNVDLSFSTS